MEKQEACREITSKLSNRFWRLNNLYRIIDEEGQEVDFRMNWAQRDLYEALWYFNTVLKARQLGFSTFFLLYMLDACLFNSNVRAGVIAQTRNDAEALFAEKIRFPFDHLAPSLKADREIRTDRSNELKFSNNSSIRVGTSMRGGTLQFLHVSELGKISAKYPEKAREIRTGALNTIHLGQFIFLESTAEGAGGEFYDQCQRAMKLRDSGKKLNEMEPRFHFYPWWRHPGYVLPAGDAVVTPEDETYFARIEADGGMELSAEQKAWYVTKAEQQGPDMKREYPSTPVEAFEASVEGAYYANEMTRARKEGRITRVPLEATVQVNTFWDLGVDDETSIWLHQEVGKEHRFFRYYHNAGEGLSHYAEWLRQQGCVYGKHYLPHDVNVTSLSTGKTRKKTLEGFGVKPIVVVPRIENLADGIQMVRNVIPKCWFDEAGCAEGIRCLDQYKREWNDKMSVWKNEPRHDAASHGADAFRQFATGYKTPVKEEPAGQRSVGGSNAWLGG